MVRLRDFVEWRTDESAPLTLGERHVTLRSQALVLNLGGRRFGSILIWHRPASVVVEEDEHITENTIPDVTRIVQWSLWGLSALFLLLGLRKASRRA